MFVEVAGAWKYSYSLARALFLPKVLFNGRTVDKWPLVEMRTFRLTRAMLPLFHFFVNVVVVVVVLVSVVERNKVD